MLQFVVAKNHGPKMGLRLTITDLTSYEIIAPPKETRKVTIDTRWDEKAGLQTGCGMFRQAGFFVPVSRVAEAIRPAVVSLEQKH